MSMLKVSVDPYGDAQACEHAADTEDEARHWSRVAIGIAKRTARRVGLDTAKRMVIDIDR